MENIIPNKNLVKNICFDNEGVNYSGGDEKLANKPYFELDKIVHPDIIKKDKVIDKVIF